MPQEVLNYSVKLADTDQGVQLEIRNALGHIVAKGDQWDGHADEDAALRNAARIIKRSRAEVEARLEQIEKRLEEVDDDHPDLEDLEDALERAHKVLGIEGS